MNQEAQLISDLLKYNTLYESRNILGTINRVDIPKYIIYSVDGCIVFRDQERRRGVCINLKNSLISFSFSAISGVLKPFHFYSLCSFEYIYTLYQTSKNERKNFKKNHSNIGIN